MREKEKRSKKHPLHKRTDAHRHDPDSEKSDIDTREPDFTIKKHLKYAKSMMSAIPEPLFVMDGQFRILSANRSFYRTLQMKPVDVEGKLFYKIGACRRDSSVLSERFGKILLNHTTVDDLEVAYHFPHTGDKTLLLNAARIDWDNGTTPLILVAVKDITKSKQADLAMQKDQYTLHAMVYEYGLRCKSMSLFNQMSEKLHSCTSLEETYPTINQFARKLFPASGGALYLLNSSRNLFEVVTSWGKSLSGQRSFKPDDCWAVRCGKTHATRADSDLSCRHLQGTDGLTALCIPLLAHKELLGVLHLQQHVLHKNTEWNELPDDIDDELQLAVTLSGHLALVLANIRLRHSLQQQAIHDPLTDLFNRRFMEETLSREIHRAKRSGAFMGIIMIDLDHFSRFNNTYGHEAGDTVLKEMGRFLKSNIRQEDVACRYGGEEFILILPGASLEITRKRAESLGRMASDVQIVHQGKVLGNITLSIGVAVFPDHGTTGRAVLQAADIALYRAKNEGRNRVC